MKQLDSRLIYYVYEHYKPGCDEPFWVGKGKDGRAYSKSGRNSWWHHIVNKHGHEIRFVTENLCEMDSLWLENMCIVGWGRANIKQGPLVNLTDGGEGISGSIRSKAWKIKYGGKNSWLYEKTGKNHPASRPVQTPLGTFVSLREAAKAHKIPESTMRNRCNRNIGYDYISGNNKQNCKILMTLKRPVKTPLGVFESVRSAARAHNIDHKTVIRRCRKMVNGFKYIFDQR